MVHRSIIGDIRRETRIYRIFEPKYFFELFCKRKNSLLRPRVWNDPFENVFLKSPARLPDGSIGSLGFHDETFGQCWTLASASDAMWQIYSKNEDGIRVRTTVGNLIDSLRAAHGDKADPTCFVGRVNYRKESELREFGRTMFTRYLGAEAIAQSLFIKRKAYIHEREVRLIYIDSETTKKSDYVYKYDIDPLSVFDQAMVDGRVCWRDFVALKKDIAKRTGLSERRIYRSLLYTPPKNFVVHLP